jgi:hypothetical protein
VHVQTCVVDFDFCFYHFDFIPRPVKTHIASGSTDRGQLFVNSEVATVERSF